MSSDRGRTPWLALGGVFLACLAGCARPTVDVSGTITIAGKEPNLPDLVIVFQAVDGAVATASVSLNGTFAAKNVPVGDLSVALMGGYPKAPTKGRRPSQDADGKAAPPEVQVSTHPIPEALRAPSTSDLKFTAVAGQPNTFKHDILP